MSTLLPQMPDVPERDLDSIKLCAKLSFTVLCFLYGAFKLHESYWHRRLLLQVRMKKE
jgi:hypothetical protein